MITNKDFIFTKKNITRNESLAVTATSREIASSMEGKGGRRNIIVRNNSPNAADIITIVRGSQAAIAGAGIMLRQGEVWYDSTDILSPCWQYEIQAVCATANGVVSITEE